MADISRLSRLVGGFNRGVDLSANTLVVLSIKVNGTELTKTILDRLVSLQDGSDVAATYHTHDGIYKRSTDLASTANGKGASLIGVEDAVGQYTSTNVEGALTEALDAAQAAQVTADAAKAEADALVTLSGRAALATNLGTFTGSTIPDSATVKSALQSLESAVEGIPDPMSYKGLWAASTNTPTLADGTGHNGDVYFVTDDGAIDFGHGSISFNQGDRVVYDGATTRWEKWDTTDQVSSVNGLAGAVTLTTSNIAEGTNLYYTAARFNTALAGKSTTDLAEGSNLYFTTARAKAAAVVNSTAGSETDQAPSVSAIKSYVDAAVAAAASEALPVLAPAGETLASAGLFALRWGRPASSETSGRLYKADNDATSVDNFHVAAIIKVGGSTLSAADPASAVKAGKLTATSHGFTVGQPIFLSTSGALTSTAPSADASASVKIGMARDANTIDVQIEIMGVN